VAKIIAGVFCEGTMHCLCLAYVADHVGPRRRAAAFGLLSGVSAAGFVSGTLTARFLPTASTFQVAAAVAVAAALYLRAFLPDAGGSVSCADEACDPLLQDSSCASSTSSSDEELSPRLPPHKGGLPSLSDMVALLTGSLALSGAATITFFYSLGEHGLQTALLYYLKAQFGYNKDEFANLLLIVGAAGMLSQLTVMPILAPILGEEMLLIVGLLGGCTHVFLYGIAWSYWVLSLHLTIYLYGHVRHDIPHDHIRNKTVTVCWLHSSALCSKCLKLIRSDLLLSISIHLFLNHFLIILQVPYFAAAFVILSAFVHPSIRTNVSKNVGSNEQGIAQGCISGISSFASILGPLIFTPLTAWFLSETEPFNFKGFSILCAGFCTLIAFVISLRMPGARSSTCKKTAVQHEQA